MAALSPSFTLRDPGSGLDAGPGRPPSTRC